MKHHTYKECKDPDRCDIHIGESDMHREIKNVW